ncbi:MAG: hypothetical protein ACKO32_13360, partial [Planctomycetia bacterium]
LEAAVKERCKDIPELPEELAITCLTDILTQRLQLSSADAMRLYAEPDVEQRALAALGLHTQRGG